MNPERSQEMEILDRPGVPSQLVARAYRELNMINRGLGNTQLLISEIRKSKFAVNRILDVGCGRGDLLKKVSATVGVGGIGVDIAPPTFHVVPIVKADARHDVLPCADVAFSTFVAHHLSEDDLIATVRNVGSYCRRFILLDVVRYWMPLMLFKIFVAPFVSPIAAADGKTSIQRGYKPGELNALVAQALKGTNATFRHSVSPFRLRQVIDITYY